MTMRERQKLLNYVRN